MIGFDFDFYECFTPKEAIDVYSRLVYNDQKVYYFNGGTELLTFADRTSITFNAAVGIAKIPELNVFNIEDEKLYIGAAIPLTYIVDDTMDYPLLSETCAGVADQTSRNQITIGGNLCSQLIYRNGILPFMLDNASVVVGNTDGIQILPFDKVYNNGLLLNKDDLVIQFIIDVHELSKPFYTKKIRKIGSFGYPALALAVVNDQGYLKAAFSGITANAFHSPRVDHALNNKNLPINERVNQAIKAIPYPIIPTLQGSPPYKRFLLKNQLTLAIKKIGGEHY